MPGQDVPFLMLAASIIVQAIAAGVVYGKLAGRVNNNSDAIKEIKGEQVRQWETIGENSEDIARFIGPSERDSHRHH